mmetsp:Transcript_11755/g.27765  ORF Transcript_11755/g.27765 Transcript_11755/m.27765 type:complete len:234 (+) Transcript_11755:1095-1796(+)
MEEGWRARDHHLGCRRLDAVDHHQLQHVGLGVIVVLGSNLDLAVGGGTEGNEGVALGEPHNLLGRVETEGSLQQSLEFGGGREDVLVLDDGDVASGAVVGNGKDASGGEGIGISILGLRLDFEQLLGHLGLIGLVLVAGRGRWAQGGLHRHLGSDGRDDLVLGGGDRGGAGVRRGELRRFVGGGGIVDHLAFAFGHDELAGVLRQHSESRRLDGKSGLLGSGGDGNGVGHGAN